MNADNDNPDLVEALTCCVCMVEESDDVPALREHASGKLASLAALGEDSSIINSIRGGPRAGARQVLFASACSEVDEEDDADEAGNESVPHALCSFCLHHLATSFGANHPIGVKHPMIPCPYPFSECLTRATGLANYFPHGVVERVLTKEEQRRYRAHAQRYQFPGFELVQCPRPGRYGTTCDAGILVSLEDIRTVEPGRLVMRCDQSQQCQRQTCYHCRSLIHRTRTYCDYCITSMENSNPKALNHYFYRPDKTMGDGKPNLWRNEELTLDLVVRQIKEIAEADRLESRCTECLTLLFKTEQCNTLEHCKIEKCYSCGRSGTPTQRLGDHWDSNGYKGCPRFDYSGFWNVMSGCKFRCVEGDCYGDEVGDCKVEEHQQGIQNMIHTRKRAHIYHALKSLLPDLRKQALDVLWLVNSVREFMPECESSDYRTYLPDRTRKTAMQAKHVLDRSSDGSEVRDDQTVQLAQNIVASASTLTFQDYSYPELPPQMVAASQTNHNNNNPKQKAYVVLFERFKSRYSSRQDKGKSKIKHERTITKKAVVSF